MLSRKLKLNTKKWFPSMTEKKLYGLVRINSWSNREIRPSKISKRLLESSR
jgi:hypothetical protein